MIRFIYLFLLLASFRLYGAVGDITPISVTSNGWALSVTIEGPTTGGTYAFGLGADNNPDTGTPKIALSVVRKSFANDGSGSVTTVTDPVYGTVEVRKPYPDQAQNQETDNGATVTVTVALNRQIFSQDTVTATILSGFYTQGGTPNNAYSGAVVNNSTYAYPKVAAAWNTPPFQLVGSEFKLRASAFQHNGRQKRPARAVKFSVTDGTSTVTQVVNNMTISNELEDAVPIPEYITTISTASFAQSSILTCNFIAYPWAGDASTLLDTSTGTAAPTPLHGPITMVCDKDGTYGKTYALVDPASGVDATGVAYDSAVYNEGTAAKFATMASAAKAIKDYNTLNRGRGDVGAGFIKLAGGNHALLGLNLGSVYGTTPNTWITIEAANGTSAEDVFITGTSGQTDISDRIKFNNITVTSAGSFTGIGATWWHNCVFNAVNTSLFRPGVHWLTSCDVQQLTQGLKSFSTENCAFAMVRGCNLSGFSGQIHYYNVIGNLKTGVVAGNPRFIGSINGSTAPAPQSQILAYNRIYGFDAGSDGANLMLAAGKNSITYEAQRGVAIIQNIFERIGTSENGTTLDFNTGDSDAYDNVMIWNNTFMGERQNAAYNSTGSVPKSRYLWSVKNNIWWDWNSKDDTFTGQSGGDGNRIGNWPIIFGVDFSGNVAGDEGADVSDFFPGVKSKHLIWNHSAAGVAADTFKFVDYRANDSVNPGTGNGDYTPTAASPAYNLQYDDLLPYDILGNERGTVDSAGAISTYVAGNTDPVIAITTPANGATEVTPVSVSATATDAEDGDISSSIVWSSNVDGVLGTGSSLSFFLSVGAHTITASITDSSLGVDTASVDITVTAPPSTGDAEAASGSAATVIIQ